MADDADHAGELSELLTDISIQQALRQQQEVPRIGRCHNCGEAVAGAFCDEDCRDDWQKRRRMRMGH